MSAGSGRGGGRRGWVASHSGANECHLCGEDMLNTRDMTKHHGRWIHKWCAPGADDE